MRVVMLCVPAPDSKGSFEKSDAGPAGAGVTVLRCYFFLRRAPFLAAFLAPPFFAAFFAVFFAAFSAAFFTAFLAAFFAAGFLAAFFLAGFLAAGLAAAGAGAAGAAAGSSVMLHGNVVSLLIGCSSGWIVDSGPLVALQERRRA